MLTVDPGVTAIAMILSAVVGVVTLAFVAALVVERILDEEDPIEPDRRRRPIRDQHVGALVAER